MARFLGTLVVASTTLNTVNLGYITQQKAYTL
jgi:hypothetical protein